MDQMDDRFIIFPAMIFVIVGVIVCICSSWSCWNSANATHVSQQPRRRQVVYSVDGSNYGSYYISNSGNSTRSAWGDNAGYDSGGSGHCGGIDSGGGDCGGLTQQPPPYSELCGGGPRPSNLRRIVHYIRRGLLWLGSNFSSPRYKHQ